MYLFEHLDWSSWNKQFNTPGMVRRLQSGRTVNGTHRQLVLAYLDIGEAEGQKALCPIAPVSRSTGSPAPHPRRPCRRELARRAYFCGVATWGSPTAPTSPWVKVSHAMWWLTPVGRLVGSTAAIFGKLMPRRLWKWL